MTCATCRHLHRTEPQGGLCRRFPPRASVLTRFRPEFGGNVPAWPNESATIWPPVRNEDRCGEYAGVPAPESGQTPLSI